MTIFDLFKKNTVKAPGIALPADIRRALKSHSLQFVEEIAWRVGYHDGDMHPEYLNLQNRIARLKYVQSDIQEIQAGLEPGQECEIIYE